jgi:hypothetical protein
MKKGKAKEGRKEGSDMKEGRMRCEGRKDAT